MSTTKDLTKELTAGITSALSKPNNGILIVELTNEEASCVKAFIQNLTMGELLPFHESTTKGLYRIMASIEDHHEVND